jgi:hypothetical protein
MPLSAYYKKVARFLVIEEVKPKLWVLRVFDPRRSGGKPIDRMQVRTMADVRRIARIYMGEHRIVREMVYHDIDEVTRYFKAEKKPLPEGVKSEIIVEDVEADIEENIVENIEADIGEDNADEVDQGAPEVHGAGEAILARPAGQTE